MPRRILLLALLLLLVLLAPAAARAQCDPSSPNCVITPIRGSVTVKPPVSPTLDPLQTGVIKSIPAGAIDCGMDCSEPFTWHKYCQFGRCETDPPPAVALEADGAPLDLKFKPSWTNCDPLPDGTCVATADSLAAVEMTWKDVGDPTVTWVAPPSVVGPDSRLAPTWEDNSGRIDRIVYTVTVGATTYEVTGKAVEGFALAPRIDPAEHGVTLTISAVAYDAAENPSPAKEHTATVDGRAELAMLATPPADVAAAPPIAFTPATDVEPGDVTCRTREGDQNRTIVHTQSPCASPYTPVTAEDGRHLVEVEVTDRLGNVGREWRSFRLDRGAPLLALTAPAPGALLGGPFSPSYTVDDGFASPAGVAVTCAFDDGAFGACNGLAPPDGPHTLVIRASDPAGNETRRHVPLTYDATAPSIAFVAGPAEREVVYDDSVAFGFAIADITPVTATCRIDGEAGRPCASATSHTLSGLRPGVHMFVLEAVDAAGHVAVASRSFAVAERPLPRLDLNVTRDWLLWKDGRTSVDRLIVRRAPAGATVTVRCRGRGCPFRTRRIAASKRRLPLTGLFGKRKLRPGTRIEIAIAKEGHVGRMYRYVLRARKSPRLVIRCVPPGAAPVRCG
jgi:hypothetical protein